MPKFCQMTIGFLIPRPCENKANFACSKCGRDICTEHAVVQTTGILCEACQLGFESEVAPGALADRTAQYGPADMMLFAAATTGSDAGSDTFSDLS